MPELESGPAARWSGGRWLGTPPADPIRGVGFDTRSLRPGSLFLALRGEARDGHHFVPQAFAAGAAAVMIDDPEAAVDGMPCLFVPSVMEGLCGLARGYRDTLGMKRIAVTGSVGKTTVKDLAADILARVAPTGCSPANWNNHLGVPLSLLACEPDMAYGVFEVGMNHPGELDPLAGLVQPDIAVVTRVGPVHIEAFDSVDGIAREKAAVYRALDGGGGIAVVNLDTPCLDTLRSFLRGRAVTVSARDTAADFGYRRVPAEHRIEVTERHTGEAYTLEAELPGDYMAENIVLAAALARTAGAPVAAVAEAVRTFQPRGLRWRRETVHGVAVINDAYNANPVSMRAAVRAFLEQPAAGRRWIVLGGMYELGALAVDAHRELGAWLAGLPVDGLVTMGPLAQGIAEGAASAGMAAVYALPDHARAAACLARVLQPGDSLLVKGSRGDAMEQVLALWSALKPEVTT